MTSCTCPRQVGRDIWTKGSTYPKQVGRGGGGFGRRAALAPGRPELAETNVAVVVSLVVLPKPLPVPLSASSWWKGWQLIRVSSCIGQ